MSSFCFRKKKQTKLEDEYTLVTDLFYRYSIVPRFQGSTSSFVLLYYTWFSSDTEQYYENGYTLRTTQHDVRSRRLVQISRRR